MHMIHDYLYISVGLYSFISLSVFLVPLLYPDIATKPMHIQVVGY